MIKRILKIISWARRKNSGVLILEEMEELDFIEETLKKQMPKKPTMLYNHERGEDRECCPSCGMIRVYKNENYCTECGQKLDWEE